MGHKSESGGRRWGFKLVDGVGQWGRGGEC
jgi:hypothetical protein